MVASLDPAGVVDGVSAGERFGVEALEVEVFEIVLPAPDDPAPVAEPVVNSKVLVISPAGELGCSPVLSSGYVVMLSEWSNPVGEAGERSGIVMRCSAPAASVSAAWALSRAERS